MEVLVEKAPVYVSAAKTLMAAAGPAQKFIQRPLLTHTMCNHQAIQILYNDGFREIARITEDFFGHLEKGTTWADEGFKNIAHFFNPRSFRGLYGWTDAVRECSLFWNKAEKNWRNDNFEKAFFYLGGAVHLIQDLCVPHHAMGILLDGHTEYEDWAEQNRNVFKIEEKGMYLLAATPAEWLKLNASNAMRNYHLVRESASEDSYHKATAALLPRAQQTTAGFIHFFMKQMNL